MSIRTNTPTRQWTLVVEGLNTFWGNTKTPGFTPSGMSIDNYKQSIIGLSDLSVDYAENAPLSDTSPIQISLATEMSNRGFNFSLNKNDPGILLTRNGSRSAGWFVQITKTVEITDNNYICIAEDYDGPSLPAILHIGNEAILFDDFYGNSADPNEPIDPMDPENTGPYRLIIDTRAVRSTRRAKHQTSPFSEAQPILTDRVVYWASRRAILYLGGLVFYRGILDRGASVDGPVATLELLPISSLLEQDIPADLQSTTLAENAHYFDKTMYWEYATLVDRSHFFTLIADDYTEGVGQVVELATVDDALRVETFYDVTRPRDCPRKGSLLVSPGGFARGPDRLISDIDTVNAEIDLFEGFPLGNITTPSIANGRHASLSRVSFAPGLVENWTQAFITEVDAQISNSRSGDDGAWMKPVFRTTSNAIEAFFRICNEIDYTEDSIRIVLWGDEQSLRTARLSEWAPRTYIDGNLVTPARLDRSLWFACDFASPDSDKFIDATLKLSDAVAYSRTLWTNEAVLDRVDSFFVTTNRVAFRDFATSWYQTGERYILTQSPLIILAQRTPVTVDTLNRATGEREQFVVFVDEISSEGDFYKLHLTPGQIVKSFGDFLSQSGSNDSKTTLSVSLAVKEIPTGELLLSILTSTGPDEADLDLVLPYGLGLSRDDLILSDFEGLVDTFSWDFGLLPTQDSAWIEVLTPILFALQRTFSVDWSPRGQGRLRLTPIGPATSDPNTTLEFSDSNVLYGSTPLTEDTWDNYNSYKFLTNYDAEGDPQVTTVFSLANDISSRKIKKELELELIGLILDNDPIVSEIQILPLGYKLVQLYSPRKMWTVDTTWDFVRFAPLGYNLLVTSRWLKGFSDDVGVVEQMARVISVNISLWDVACSLKMVAYGFNTKGWSPGCAFKGVVDADCDAVTNIELSDTDQPLDVMFPVGSKVDVMIRGDQGGESQATILFTNTGGGGTFTFTAPVGCLLAAYDGGAGTPLVDIYGYVVPSGYSLATDYHKEYAFLADTDDEVATGVEGDFII